MISRAALEVCILAGGLSMRMGRDKSRLRIDGQTMLARVRATAAQAFSPETRVRVIRKDQVRRCGPLGGIVTGLRTTKARAVLFLACDMPLVSSALLKRIVRASRRGARAVFASQSRRVGFPLVLPTACLARVEGQIAAKEFSVHALAAKLRAHHVTVRANSGDLFNVNTPEETAVARTLLR